MKTLRNKRKDIGLAQKFKYIALAIDYMDYTKKKQRTDVIGLARSFSSQPKLKREDFEGIMDMTLNEIGKQLKLKV